MRNLYFTGLSIGIFIYGSVGAQTGPAGIGATATNPLWLDASLSGNPTTGPTWFWNDRSGNAVTASSTLFAGRPSLQSNQINGFSAFLFDGVNDHFQTPGLGNLNTTDVTWFVVGTSNNNTVKQSFFSMGHGTSAPTNNHRFTMVYNPYNTISGCTRTDGTTALSGFGNITGSNSILSTTTNSSAINCFINGNLNSSQVSTYLTPGSCTRSSIGRRAYHLDAYLNGKVAEIIVYSFTLGQAQRTIVENYLSSKYNIAIGNDHYAMESSGHYFEVAGIGQESGNSVTNAKGTGIVTISNPSSLGDGDYLLWGHNNAAFTATSTGVPTFFSSFNGLIMTRTWRADVTGTPGTVDVSFDLTGRTFGSSNNDYILLIDDDGNFANGGTQYVGSGFSFNAGTNTASWTGVTIPDGAYFTIANADIIFSIADGNWTTPATWSCNCVPSASDNVAIIGGDNVIVNTSGCVALGLGSEVGTSLSFSSSSLLTLSGNLGWDGTWNSAQSSITFAGSSAQNISATSTVAPRTMTINNSNGVTVLSGNITVALNLTLTAGNLNVTAANSFTLLSNATETARIASVGTGSVTGNFTIQRFISTRAAGFSDLSSPVTASTMQDWDNELIMIYTYNPPGAYPSAWSYDENVAFDYVPITSAATPLVPGVGYEVYLDSDGGQTNFFATTINTVGTPNIGTVSTTITRTNDGWNLVGNPYASFVSINTLRTQNPSEIAATWGFYDETIGDFSYLSGGSVAPHQGFWVESLQASTSLDFNETAKTTSNSSTFRNTPEVHLSLKLESEGLTHFTSSTHFDFDPSFVKEYEMGSDVTFKKVPHDNAPALYAMSSDGKALRISKLPNESNLEIPLEYNVGIEGFYTLSINDMSIAQDLGYSCVVLEDKKTGSFHDLSSGAYRFNASQNEKSRFVLHLSNNNSACEKIQSSAVAALEGVNINRTSEGVFVEYNLDSDQSSVISVVNVLGQDIVNARSVSVSTGKIRIQLPADYNGIFIVNVQLGDKMISKKFFNL